MSNLFEKLMEEAERVNALNVEVDKIVEQHEKEVEDWRLGKRRHIGEFLLDVSEAFEVAKYPKNQLCDIMTIGDFLLRLTGRRYTVRLQYCNGIRFEVERAGGYILVSRYPVPELKAGWQASMAVEGMVDPLTDAWNQDFELEITNRVTKILKAWLAKRVDTMGDALKEASRRVGE